MATASVGHHSGSPFAPQSVPSRSTHPVGGSNRHPPEAVSYATTEHFGQATGAINVLSCVETLCGPFSILAWPLLRFLLVILMIVKEASYLPLERRCLLQITDGTGAVEELPLELRGNGIPAHKHGRAQTLQNLLFFVGKGSTVVVILSPLNRLIDIYCHPFFV